MKARIPLVGQPNQRNLDSLQALIEGKDQRYRNIVVVPIQNPLAGTVKHYAEKRPGLEENCPAAFGDRGTNIFYSRATDKVLAFFVDADNIHTPYVDCVDVGPFDLDETPIDRGDGRFVAVTDSAIGGVAGKNVMWAVSPGNSWNTTTLTGNLANTAIPWNDISWGGRVFMATSTSFAGPTKSKGMVSPSGEDGSWTEITLPDQPNETANWPRPFYIRSKDEWVLSCGNNEWRVPRSTDDGANWTLTGRLDTGLNAMLCQGIAYSPELDVWVACGGNVSSVPMRYSDNDLTSVANCTLAAGGNFTTGGTWRDVVWSPAVQKFVAVRSDGLGGAFAYSSNGKDDWVIVGTDTDGNALTMFRIIQTPLGLFGATSGTGGTHGRDFYWSTTGTSFTRIELASGSGIYSRINYNGSVLGAAGYGNATNFKNFASASSQLPTDGSEFNEYVDVVPSTNVTGLSSRWAWWL